MSSLPILLVPGSGRSTEQFETTHLMFKRPTLLYMVCHSDILWHLLFFYVHIYLNLSLAWISIWKCWRLLGPPGPPMILSWVSAVCTTAGWWLMLELLWSWRYLTLKFLGKFEEYIYSDKFLGCRKNSKNI